MKKLLNWAFTKSREQNTNSAHKPHLLVGLFLVLGLFGFIVANSDTTEALDRRIVTVFADGVEHTISTDVLTVGEALEKANIDVAQQDLIEPAKDTEIIDSTFRINVYRARPVTVVDGHRVETVMTPYQSPRLIAADAGIDTYYEDNFSFERIDDDILTSKAIGERMTIIRSVPININLYGKTIEARTHKSTVAEVLAEKDISLKEQDIIAPALDKEIKAGMTISIVRVGTDTVAVEEEVDYPTETIHDSNRLMGERQVKTAGVKGHRLVTYEVELHNGQEVSRNEIQSVVTEQPQAEVVIVGTLVPDPSSNAAIGQSIASQHGWVGAEWTCLYNLWMKESGWNHSALNASSGAAGIPQALPGSKMASAGADWASNPATQIQWGLSYIEGRYGSPCGAYSHSASVGWY